MLKDNTEEEVLFTHNESTIIKAIGILCVFFCHLGNYFTRFTTPLGGIGVALFLIISGYGLEKSALLRNGELECYWRKRIISVWFPYFLMELLMIPLQTGYGIAEFILDITLLEPRFGLGWYLNYLFIWYIAFWLVHKLPLKGRHKCLALFLFSVILAIYYCFDGCRFEQSFSFLIGVLAADYEIAFKKRFNWKNFFVLIIFGILLLGIKQLDFIRALPVVAINILDLFMKSSIAVALIIFAWQVLRKYRDKNKGYKILLTIGTVSYELYLVHGYALNVFGVGLSRIYCVLIFILISALGTNILYRVDKLVSKNLKQRLIKKS